MTLRTTIVAAALSLAACSGGESPTGNANIAAVEVTAASYALQLGQKTQLSATAVDAGGVAIPGAGSVSWQSSGLDVATVNGSGQVTAVGVGVTSISATIRGYTGAVLVSVLPQGAGAIVTMPGESYVPFQVSVNVGQSVYFEFPALAHNVIFEQKTGAPADIEVTSNQVISRQFNAAGQFLYDCTLHTGMTGVVVVQ